MKGCRHRSKKPYISISYIIDCMYIYIRGCGPESHVPLPRSSRKIKAPWTPQLDNKLDLSNFDTYDEDDQVPEFTGDQSPFSSF